MDLDKNTPTHTHIFLYKLVKKCGPCDELVMIVVIRNDAGNPSFRMKMHCALNKPKIYTKVYTEPIRYWLTVDIFVDLFLAIYNVS